MSFKKGRNLWDFELFPERVYSCSAFPSRGPRVRWVVFRITARGVRAEGSKKATLARPLGTELVGRKTAQLGDTAVLDGFAMRFAMLHM